MIASISAFVSLLIVTSGFMRLDSFFYRFKTA